MARILVTNDDGIFSEGIKLLAEELSAIAEVWVVAPDREQSAMGHALTLSRPLRLQKVAERSYAVDGTPTDCVNLGVHWVLKDDPPDLICSGINFGLNLGDDVTYSGTVSATFEGTLMGIPSIAFSQEIALGFSFARGAAFARAFVSEVLADALPPDVLLNVNIPAAEIQGVSFTRLGRRSYSQSIVEKIDPRGRKYYWIAGIPKWQADTGTDHEAVSNGRVSVTPLHLDLTYYPGLERLSSLKDRLTTFAWEPRPPRPPDAPNT
jgi:5'-nucleotidase